jgi:hypothetical protein
MLNVTRRVVRTGELDEMENVDPAWNGEWEKNKTNLNDESTNPRPGR